MVHGKWRQLHAPAMLTTRPSRSLPRALPAKRTLSTRRRAARTCSCRSRSVRRRRSTRCGPLVSRPRRRWPSERNLTPSSGKSRLQANALRRRSRPPGRPTGTLAPATGSFASQRGCLGGEVAGRDPSHGISLRPREATLARPARAETAADRIRWRQAQTVHEAGKTGPFLCLSLKTAIVAHRTSGWRTGALVGRGDVPRGTRRTPRLTPNGIGRRSDQDV